MKKYCLLLLLFLPFAALADDLRDAYVAGYERGLVDQQARVEFIHHIATPYQNAAWAESCEAQLAYTDGYVDGYFRRPSRESQMSGTLPSDPVVSPQPLPSDGGFVTVYDEEGFTGKSQRFQIGRYSDLDDDWDDKIESIRLTGGVRVILYDNENFGGEKIVLERDAEKLGDFEERAASIIVEPMAGGTVTVYKEPGYRGSSREFEVGEYPDLDDEWDDDIESIQISGAVRVILFDDENFRGERMVVDQDLSTLGELRNEAESMIVEPLALDALD